MRIFIQRLVLLAAALAASVPALAHNGNHDEISPVDYWVHVLAHAEHLLPIVGVAVVALILRAVSRERHSVRSRRR